MKILVDTNVMIDYMKRPSEKMKEVFQEEDVVISGVVTSELLHGALSENELKALEEDLDVFESLNIAQRDIGTVYSECGTYNDRDGNAAKNILKIGLSLRMTA